MRSGSEVDVQAILDDIAPARLVCAIRKDAGQSIIGKPVDLEIRLKALSQVDRVVVAVAVANR